MIRMPVEIIVGIDSDVNSLCQFSCVSVCTVVVDCLDLFRTQHEHHLHKPHDQPILVIKRTAATQHQT